MSVAAVSLAYPASAALKLVLAGLGVCAIRPMAALVKMRCRDGSTHAQSRKYATPSRADISVGILREFPAQINQSCGLVRIYYGNQTVKFLRVSGPENTRGRLTNTVKHWPTLVGSIDHHILADNQFWRECGKTLDGRSGSRMPRLRDNLFGYFCQCNRLHSDPLQLLRQISRQLARTRTRFCGAGRRHGVEERIIWIDGAHACATIESIRR